MPSMMAAQHFGFVNALLYGTARNQATINAALAALGSSVAWLVLDFTGDGVWTVTSNTSINRLYVPMGVTVNVASGVTLAVNLIMAPNSGWKTGPGAVSKAFTGQAVEISQLACTTYYQANSSGGEAWTLDGGTADPAAIHLYLNNGGAGCGISMSRSDPNPTTATWQINAINAGDLDIVRPGGSPKIKVNNNGVMINSNVGATHALQMGNDDAFKATASWSTPSDERLKTVLGDYTDGVAMVLALPQTVRFTFNGKAGTPTDGKEQVGMLAQDVEPVAPYMISSYQDKLEPDDPTPTAILSMNNASMVYMLINAVKELDARLTALESPARRGRQVADTPDETAPPESEDDPEASKPTRRKRAS